jgi:hypothetical protein
MKRHAIATTALILALVGPLVSRGQPTGGAGGAGGPPPGGFGMPGMPQLTPSQQAALRSLDQASAPHDQALREARNALNAAIYAERLDTGVCWIKNWGQGRVFYTNLGHGGNHAGLELENTPVLEHYLLGIQWAFGDLKPVDATPKGAKKN